MDVVVVERGHGHDMLAVVRRDAHRRPYLDQHRRHVTRRDGIATLAIRGDPADIAALLEAEIERFSSRLRLVVIVAARIEARIAAEGAHLAQLRRGGRVRLIVQQRARVAYGKVRDPWAAGISDSALTA